MHVKHHIRGFLRARGIDVVRHNTKRLLKTYGIETVLDVGANVGQYGQQLRSIGYHGRIVSFEPLKGAYAKLREVTRGDRSWETLNYALGDTEGTAVINIAANSYSSSILDMLPSHVEAAGESYYVGKEEITIKTLDTVFPSVCPTRSHVLLKLDTQGFEKKVLLGAAQSLGIIDTIQLEMSLVPLYRGEALFDELYHILRDAEYTLVGVEQGFSDKQTGQMLQIEGTFHRYR
ncbi:MAG: FkbM family methyltransferase [Gemmatimonadota bacterium]|nr:FkbM family methyltransferase [Gemmatimonadota bacterium]